MSWTSVLSTVDKKIAKKYHLIYASMVRPLAGITALGMSVTSTVIDCSMDVS